MTNRTYFHERRWATLRTAPVGPVVTCLACQGDETVNCLTCQNRRIIEADRVCAGCGRFKSYCQCHHNELGDDVPRKPGRPGRSRAARRTDRNTARREG